MRMVLEQNSRELAQLGLQHIEDAILRLLDANPQGLRNVDVARALELRSDFPGRQRDYISYSVLGGLLARGLVDWNQQSKLFTKKNANISEIDQAQYGLRRIEDAILILLKSHPEGLGNSEIADLLDLRSEFRGRQKNYLTYSVLGGLISQGKVNWDSQAKLFSVATEPPANKQVLDTPLRELTVYEH